MDRERVSLSLKSTQEDRGSSSRGPTRSARSFPGRVTKLCAVRRVRPRGRGHRGHGAHLRAGRPPRGESRSRSSRWAREIFVKIIDIDLDRRRISLSIKQANEGAASETAGDEFDPTLYGMPATYDEAGKLPLPRRLRPESGDWPPRLTSPSARSGSGQYAEARARFEAHRKQIEESRAKAEEEGEAVGETAVTSQSAPRPRGGSRPAGPENNAPTGTLLQTRR